VPADSNSLDMFVIADTVKHNLYRGNSRHTLMKKQQTLADILVFYFTFNKERWFPIFKNHEIDFMQVNIPKYRNSIPLP